MAMPGGGAGVQEGLESPGSTPPGAGPLLSLMESAGVRSGP